MSSIPTILAGELHQLADELASQAPALSAGSEDAAAECLSLCERLGQVAEMIEAPALQDVAIFLMSNIPALLGNEAATHAPAALCAELELCLLEGFQSQRWPSLSANFADSRWPASMDPDAAASVAANLKPLSIDTQDPTELIPRPALTHEDLSLQPPNDVGYETLQAFFQEAPLQSTQLTQALSAWTAESQEGALALAQRLAHTLKGSSALCGMHAIAHLVHAMETILQSCADTASLPPSPTRLRLLEAGDMVEQLVELASLGAQAPAELLEFIESLHVSEDSPCEESPCEESSFEDTNCDEETGCPPVPAHTASPPVVTAVANEITPTLNVPIALIDDNLRRAGEMNVAIGQLLAQVTSSVTRANHLAQQLALVQGQVYELETLVDTRGIPASKSLSGTPSLAVPHDFDPLEMDEYTALHSLSRAFAESTLDSRELSRELGDELLKLQNLIAQHARLGKDLTDSVMGTRLVPVATIVPRLERIVRQTARQTQREIDLIIEGRDLSLDTDILNGLVEPLLHALRNAIDHGIEQSDERVEAGKPTAGLITVKFRREGNRIEVSCRDDGRGLDYDAIATRARERGLIAPDAHLSQNELSNLVFAPGFSTRSEVTAISGRGVGMDIVRASIERLKGTVKLESRAGDGCTLTFRLPVSLTSAHALFVGVGEATYGLPSTSVEQVLYSDAGRVLVVGDQHAFEYAGQVAPLYTLAQLLGHSSDLLNEIESRPTPLVLVQSDAGLVALAVDRALDSRQIVIKGLPKILPTIPGIAGACVLPNGAVGVIIEVRELLRRPTAVAARSVVAAPEQTSLGALRALVVDDSLSARRTLAQLLGDCGFDVTMAIDGLDAIESLETHPADVILVDMEMPRMNGLDLTAHLRADSRFHGVPIVMITSRAAEKHRVQALRAGVTDYVTKPYLEQDLLARIDRVMTDRNETLQ